MQLRTSPDRIVDAITRLAAARTLDDVTRVVRSAARDLVRADGATFVLRERGFCAYVDEDAIGPLWKGRRFPIENCVTGWAMTHKTPAVIPDIEKDERVPFEAYRTTFVRSMAAIPIRAADPIGAIGVYWTTHHQADEEELRDLQNLANAASVAMENVRLLNEFRQSRDEARSTAMENRRLLELASSQLAERRVAEEDLRKHVEHMDLALAAGNMGTWTIDFGRSLINRSLWFTTVLRLDATTVAVQDPFIDMVHPEDRPRYIEAMARTRDAGEPFDLTYRATTVGGRELYLRSVARRAEGTGAEGPRVFGATLDLTDLRSLQGQLLHAQKMETVARLAGGMAHDFNNALTTIFCWLDMAESHAPAGTPIAEARDGILHAAEHAAGLTKQLLAFARKQVLATKRVDLAELTRRSLPLIRPLVGDSVNVTVLQSTDNAWVMADRGQIEQVLMNLASNARDAMPRGGTLSVSIQRLEEIGRTPSVRLSVADTGTGIPPEVLTKIFDPFFTTKPAGKGTGLGLSSVLGIVEQHGGVVDVQSTPQGTRFDITLPAAQTELKPIAERKIDPVQARTQAAGPERTVLVVDDQDLVRNVTSAVLQDAGFKILQASSPAEALSILKATSPTIDLLVTDMVMPGMTGLELARRLRQAMPDLRVVVTSGYNDQQIDGLHDELPDLHYLPKPFTPKQLVSVVKNALDAQPSVAPAPTLRP